MKKCALIILVMLILLTGTALADGIADYCEAVDDAMLSNIIDYCEITMLEQEIASGTIKNYAVNAVSGDIAVCYCDFSLSSKQKAICVFDGSGDFLYGYTFKDSGTAYVSWIGSNTAILSVRSSVAVSVTDTGKIENAYYYPASQYDNDPVQYHGENTYKAYNPYEKVLSAIGYTGVLCIDEYGNESEIISVKNGMLKSTLSVVAFFLIMLLTLSVPAIVVIAVLRGRKQRRARIAELKKQNRGAEDYFKHEKDRREFDEFKKNNGWRF